MGNGSDTSIKGLAEGLVQLTLDYATHILKDWITYTMSKIVRTLGICLLFIAGWLVGMSFGRLVFNLLVTMVPIVEFDFLFERLFSYLCGGIVVIYILRHKNTFRWD